MQKGCANIEAQWRSNSPPVLHCAKNRAEWNMSLREFQPPAAIAVQGENDDKFDRQRKQGKQYRSAAPSFLMCSQDVMAV